jgi:predicted component of type VI protein secretion system
MKLSLVVLTTGKMEGKTLEIKIPQFVIGRDADCNLRPASPLISKRHCALTQRDERVFVQDFGSTNGTHVNDVPVEGEVELKDGDVLKIGPIQFAIRLEATVPAAAKPAPATKAAPSAPPVKAGAAKATTPDLPPKTHAALPAKTAKTQPRPAPEKPAAVTEKPPAITEKPPAITEKPAAAAASGGSSGKADDDIAAMLLSLSDDTSSGALFSSADAENIPEGSTVHDLKVPEDVLEGDKKDDQLAKTKAAQANTSSAARSILDKYLKRPRS